MTPSEFISAAAAFERGSFVVVSGNDQDKLGILLSGAQVVIEAGGIPALLYDSRATESTQVPKYQTCDIKFQEDDCGPSYQDVGVHWESKVLLASGSMVTLVGNYFDNLSARTNLWRTGLPADVVIDVLEWYNVRGILDSDSKKFSGKRALDPFMTSLYWYDGTSDQVTHVKDQEAELPSSEEPPFLTEVRSEDGLPIGPTVGKQVVTLKGENFYPGAKVDFDGRVAMDVEIVNSNVISCLTPGHPLGLSNVTVRTKFGTALLSSGYYFVS